MCRPTWCPSGHHCPEGLTCMLVFAIFSAVLGMFQFGYNSGVINAPHEVMKEFIATVYRNKTGKYIPADISSLIWSITVSIFAIGGMIGGIGGGSIADWCGRKCGLLLNNAIAILGATLMSSSQLFKSIECLILGRFFIGLNCGLNTALVPMYLSEIAPMTLRGALGTVSQLGVTIGLLLSQILGLDVILGTEAGWPFLLGVAFIPAVLQLLLLPMCPESPRYLLLSKGRLTEARCALQRLRCSSEVEDDIEEMRLEERAQQAEGTGLSMWQIIRNKQLQMPLIIGIVMQLSQQLSGINAIFYYSTTIFSEAGVPSAASKIATIGVGIIMVTMTLVSIPLMDRAGRRTLHLYGLGGMFITSIFLTISLLVQFIYKGMTYMSVISAFAFVVFFAIGPGSIPWLITAELFSQGSRPAAISIAVLVNWSTNFLVGLGFPLMQKVFDNYSFLPFTGFLAIFWTFTYHKVPETKNRTFEEISALFRRDDFVNSSLENSMELPPKGLPVVPPQAQMIAAQGQIHAHPIPHPHQLLQQPPEIQMDDKGLESCLHVHAHPHHHHHHHCHCHYGATPVGFPPQIPLPPLPANVHTRKKVAVTDMEGEMITSNHVIEDQL